MVSESLAEIEEGSYAEFFRGIVSRVIITADDRRTARAAARDSTALPSAVINRDEGGVERWLSKNETPDKREGALVQYWGAVNPKKPFIESLNNFETELSYRIRQGVLVKLFTSVYDALPNAKGKFDVQDRIGHCGDAWEWDEERYERTVTNVTIMVPEFLIERQLGYAEGFMGANFWVMCKTKEAVRKVGQKALKAIHEVEGVVTPFDVCSAGSKPGGKFPWLGSTTNEIYCPSIKKKLGATSKVPDGVKYIPEIVINGLTENAVKKAMQVGIEAVRGIDGVYKISAGNYGEKLGEYKIKLEELMLRI